MCSENMQQIYRRTPMPKCDFNKVTKHGCSPVNLLHIFRTHFPKNTSGWLLLEILNIYFSRTLSTVQQHFFKKFILTAAFTIYFFKLFHLSPKRVRKLVGLLRKVQNVLPRTFKSFARPHFDHGNIIYGKHKTLFFIAKQNHFSIMLP